MEISNYAVGDVVKFMFLSNVVVGVIKEILLKENRLSVLDETNTYHRVAMSKEESKFCYLIK